MSGRGRKGLEKLLSFGFTRAPIPLRRIRDMSSVMGQFGANTVSCNSVSRRTRRALTVTVGRLRKGSGANRNNRDSRELSSTKDDSSEYSTVGRITDKHFNMADHCLMSTERVRVGVTRNTGPNRNKRLPTGGMCP